MVLDHPLFQHQRGLLRAGSYAAPSLHGSGPVTPDRAARKRGAEAFDLAFLLLGGRRAANGFLDSVHPGLAEMPRARVAASPLGLVEVVRVLRREALNPAAPEFQA